MLRLIASGLTSTPPMSEPFPVQAPMPKLQKSSPSVTMERDMSLLRELFMDAVASPVAIDDPSTKTVTAGAHPRHQTCRAPASPQ